MEKSNQSAVKEVSYEVDKNREITVEFMTALNESTPMVFRSETKKIKSSSGRILYGEFLCGK